MSSLSPPSPLAIPLKYRRKSLSTSTTTSTDMLSLGDAAPYPSLPSSLPSLAPLHVTRRNECMEWQGGDYVAVLDLPAYNQPRKEDATRPWSCLAHPFPYMHRPLPSLMTKFAAHTLRSDASLSYSPSALSYDPKTMYLYSQGDSTIADDCEEYDLESMDIHIRETYFATSAERGRWLSSPIAPRVRSKATPLMRGHSSPIKTLTDASPVLGERVRRHKTSCPADEQISTSSLENRNDDVRCSSPLPPSSPMTSPISNLSFLSDFEGDPVVGPCSNSDDCHSRTRTPELTIPSTTCTSPVELTRVPTPHEAPVPTHHPTDFSCRPARSTISRHTSPHPPRPIDVHVHTPGATGSEPGILSPLSQFELDLPEAEPPKLPLSDTVNKPYPGQHSVTPVTNLEAARSQDGLTSVQSLSMNLNCQLSGVLLDTIGGSGSNTKAKRRRPVIGSAGARRTRKRADIWPGTSSDTKTRKGTESCSSTPSEPPCKKSKLSQFKDGFEARGAKSLPRRSEISKIKRLSRSPSRSAVDGCDSESACPRKRKIAKPTRRTQLQQPTSKPCTALVSTDPLDVGFHASLTGMLIEALATSRATSMDASALHLVLTQAHPYLTTARSKGELLMDIAAVLEAGRTRCGMFEKVDGSGERSRNKAPESRWFYVPERDEDRERASLISAIMPRQKRNETKKYKQYYYRPLDKMSRWDPEDAP